MSGRGRQLSLEAARPHIIAWDNACRRSPADCQLPHGYVSKLRRESPGKMVPEDKVVDPIAIEVNGKSTVAQKNLGGRVNDLGVGGLRESR
jgi:hypothetical protein